MNQTQVISEMVAESTLRLADVNEATLGTSEVYII